MKKFRTLKILIVILIGIAVIHFIFFRNPSESQMFANFKAHKVQLEQLRSMLQQDKNVKNIAPDFVEGDGGHSFYT